MAKVRVNFKLIIVLLIAFAILIGSAIALRKIFRTKTIKESYRLGSQAYQQKQWDTAAVELGKYVAIRKDEADILMMYADAQIKRRPFNKGNIRLAVSAYRQVIRLEPDNRKAYQSLVNIYMNMSAYSEAKAKAQEFLENNSDPNIALDLARAMIGIRQFKQAYKHLLEMTEKYSDYIPTYELLATYTHKSDDFKGTAISWLNKAVGNNPNSPMAYIIRGSWLYKMGQKIKAIQDFDKAVKIGITDSETKTRLAHEYVLAEQIDKAQKLLDDIQKVEPGNLNLWKVKALIALVGNDKQLINTTAEQALKNLGYNDWDFLNIACELFIKSGNFEQASKCIEKLGTIEESRPTVLYYKGVIEYRKKNSVATIKYLREAVNLGYTTPRARIILASAYSDTGDTTAGIQQLRALVSEHPENFQAQLNLAKLLAQNNDPSGAAEQAQVALQLNPASDETMMLYIRSRMKVLVKAGISKDSVEWIELEDKLNNFHRSGKAAQNLLYNKLRLALGRGKIVQAQEYLTELKEQYPSLLETALGQIEIAFASSDVNLGQSLLEKAVEKFPTRSEPYLYSIELSYRNKQYDKCIKLAWQGFDNTESSRAKLQFAEIMADLAKYTASEDKIYDKIVEVERNFPESITIKRKLLNFDKTIADVNSTKALISQIKEIEGESGWQWRYEQARVLYLSRDKNDYPQIISLLKEAITNAPASKEPRLLLGAVYAQKGDNTAAISTYKQSLNRWPDDPQIITPLVAALYRANEYSQAEQLLKKASVLKISNPALEKLQLQTQMQAGNFQVVSQILTGILKNDPKDKDAILSLALLNMREGKFDQSQQMIDKLKKNHESSFVIDVAQIELFMRQDKKDMAISACNKLIEKYSNAQAYIIRGRNYMLLADKEKAGSDFEKAVALDKTSQEAWTRLIDFYKDTGEYKKALETARKALKAVPGNLKLQKKAIIVFGASQDLDDIAYSGKILSDALKTNPSDSDLVLLNAMFLISKGDPPSLQQAQDSLDKLTEDYPNITRAWQILANLNLQLNNPDRALYYADRGLTYSPGDAKLLLIKANALLKTSPFSAIKILRELNADSPEDLNIILTLARAYIQADNAEKAIELLENSIKSADKTGLRPLKLMLATAFYKAGKIDESKQLFKQLSKDSSDDAVILTRINILMEEQKWYDLVELVGNWSAENKSKISLAVGVARRLIQLNKPKTNQIAEDLLKRLLALDSENLEVMGTLGVIYQLNGKTGPSADMYRGIIAREPGNVVAMNNLAWILSENKGQYQKALELTSQAIKMTPEFEDLYDTRGVIYFRMGEYEKAIKNFQTCMQLIAPGKPQAAGAYFHLGRTYAEMGDTAKAVENLNRALSLDPTGAVLSPDDISTVRRLLYKLKKR